MAEYIEREAAMYFPFANGQYDHKNADPHFVNGCESYREWLEAVPAADVVPVVRAKWEVIDQEEPRRYICTNCHCLSWGEYNFCHHCGARMDGDGDV